MEFENLFKPIRIGPVEIKNRIALAPCNLHFSQGGFVTDQYQAYYAARAKGGVGLLIVGGAVVYPPDIEPTLVEIPFLFDVKHVVGFDECVERIHEHGAMAFIQLGIGQGRQTRGGTGEVVSPSAVPMGDYIKDLPGLTLETLKKMQDRYIPLARSRNLPVLREITTAEILQRQELFVKSARLAMSAGFDGIELHVAHGYLGHQFLSPRTNKRTDAYGGSLENRMRFLIEMVKKGKAAIQNQCALGVRISSAEHVPGGFTVEDTKIVVRECEKAGANYISLSDGCQEATKYMFPEEEREHLLDEAKELKKGLEIPVITPSIHDPVHAENAIREGKTDMIAMGRQLMADPDWANKVKEGRVNDIRRCKRDSTCLLWLYTEGQARCIVNPNLGRERFMPEYWPQRRSAKLPASLLKRSKKS